MNSEDELKKKPCVIATFYLQKGRCPSLKMSANSKMANEFHVIFTEKVVETIFCGVTTVRLVSSGEFDNAVTIAVRPAEENDIPTASLVCGL